jgi:hypothetical protein
MSLQILDPTHEADPRKFRPAARLESLQGATVGLLSNGKKGTKPFFAALAAELEESYGVARVVQVTKRNFSAPAEPEIFQQAKQWNALVAGVGD